jgi:hypothetical protein
MPVGFKYGKVSEYNNGNSERNILNIRESIKNVCGGKVS